MPAVGFGTLSLGVLYPDKRQRPSRAQAIGIVHALLDAGCRFFDTADTYCADARDLHYVERLLAEAFESYGGGRPADLFVATKGGMRRTNNGENSASAWMTGSNAPASVRSQIRDSHAALGGRHAIDLWQVHHVHAPAARLVDATLAAVRAALELVAEGLVRYVGLCNASVAQLEACVAARLPIVAVQNEFSLFEQAAAQRRLSAAHKTSARGVLEYCAAHSLAFIAHGPLGGLKAKRGDRSLADLAPLADVARRNGTTPHALALAAMIDVRWRRFLFGRATGCRATDIFASLVAAPQRAADSGRAHRSARARLGARRAGPVRRARRPLASQRRRSRPRGAPLEAVKNSCVER